MFCASKAGRPGLLGIARNRLAENEQKFAAAIMSRAFYLKVVEELEKQLNPGLDVPSSVVDAEEAITQEALAYVNALTRAKEVLPLGAPVVYRAPRGALKKTVIAGFGVFILSCMLAFVYE